MVGADVRGSTLAAGFKQLKIKKQLRNRGRKPEKGIVGVAERRRSLSRTCGCADGESMLDLADNVKVTEPPESEITSEESPTFASSDAGSDTPAEEFEESSLAATETRMVEMASMETPSAVPSNSDDLIPVVDLAARPTKRPQGAPISDAMAINVSKSALEEESEADAIAQEAQVESQSAGECDYSVGSWVRDNSRPLYSGLECNMWLSPGFSCRLHNHPDKLLDRYRWQPAGCDLPQFNASAVLHLYAALPCLNSCSLSLRCNAPTYACTICTWIGASCMNP